MRLLLVRSIFSPRSTIGDMSVDDDAYCKTLELPWKNNEHNVSCIPEGVYKVAIDMSSAHHQRWPHILDVPNRGGVRIDIANYPSQILGCIAVGKTAGVDSIGQSAVVWHDLFRKIDDAQKRNEEVTLEITSRQPLSMSFTQIGGVPMLTAQLDWKPGFPDWRDAMYLYKNMYTDEMKAAVQPTDLRPFDSPILDQGHEGSCTGHALVGACQYLELKDKIPFVALSRQFIYFSERFLEGTIKEDSGAQIRNGIKGLKRWGVCTEDLWPYDKSNMMVTPPDPAYADALHRRIAVYAKIKTPDEMKACLFAGFPFVGGFPVFESMETPQCMSTGIIPIPQDGEKVLGGHAIMIVGFTNDHLIVRNSWGTAAGDKGYFYMPFWFVENGLMRDCWTIRKGVDPNYLITHP